MVFMKIPPVLSCGSDPEEVLYPAEIYEAFKKSGLCFPTTRLKLNP
jgi:hypothetical protein